jgi:flagellin-like protein
MNLKKLFNDDDAVSPVIGVILMVAITVILAAVIASFVLGLGDQNNPAPTVDFEFDYNSGDSYVQVTHGDGDEVEAQNLYIRGQNLDSASFSSGTSGSWNNLTDISPPSSTVNDYSSGDAISAGKSAYVSVSGDGYVINVVWEDPDSDSTSTLSTDRGPDA